MYLNKRVILYYRARNIDKDIASPCGSEFQDFLTNKVWINDLSIHSHLNIDFFL